MRIHALNIVIAVGISALLAYGLWQLGAGAIRGTVAVGGFAFLASTLTCAIALRYADARVGVSVRAVGWIFFVVALGLNLGFALAGASQPIYLITCGIAFLVFLLAANGVFSAAQS